LVTLSAPRIVRDSKDQGWPAPVDKSTGVHRAKPRAALNSPVLLTEPSYSGTLAAARDLGRRGIRVATAAATRGTPTAHSRYVDQHWRSPPATDIASQVRWLEQFGRDHPGTVLYPTSDSFAWLQTAFAARIAPHFLAYAPDVNAIENVLDKRKLHEACRAVGLDTPATYFAESEADVAAVADHARFPLLLKQRTQIFSNTASKGALILWPEDLLPRYRRFVAVNRHAPEVRARMPFASWPLMQEFCADAKNGSYLVSGFVNSTHTEIAAKAAVKVLQYPRTLGIALCMEQAQLDPKLTARILALCRLTGYFGVFQIEFLTDGERKLLIDFNPRYYHYMAFDMARGLQFPWFAQLGACGHEEALAAALAQARTIADAPQLAFSSRLQFNEMLWAQRLTGTMSAIDVRRWRSWRRKNQGCMVDALADPKDRWPESIAALSNLWRHLRHPRAFINKIALDR
jgi:D-aspartate ligase